MSPASPAPVPDAPVTIPAAPVPPVDLDAVKLGAGTGTALGGAPPREPLAVSPGERILPGAPVVDLARLALNAAATNTPGADPAAATRVAEAAGHAVPRTPAELADEAVFLDADELTGAEVALLRRFLRDGFPGERVVTPAQAREIRGHLGGQSMY